MLTSIYLCLMLHNFCDNQLIAVSHHHQNHNVHLWNQLITFNKSYQSDEDNQYEQNSFSELQVYQSSPSSVLTNYFTNENYSLTNTRKTDNYSNGYYTMKTVKKHRHKQGNIYPIQHRQRNHRHRRIALKGKRYN